MPELPEVETVRRQLHPVLSGARITDVAVRRPDLRIPFPPRFRSRLRGQTVAALTRRAKYLMELSSGETLLMHLGMSGSLRIEWRGAVRPPVHRHDHVVFDLDSGARVLFNDPRRFGFMDLLTPMEREQHAVLNRLGPEPLSREFDRR
jgi:formamidopyrimidine-DNA glycosylase